ncbi:hypothetical protein NST84_09435 [Paenibacillus sp. FSL R7-0345]
MAISKNGLRLVVGRVLAAFVIIVGGLQDSAWVGYRQITGC